MTNHPDNWIPERIPAIGTLVVANGAIACTLEGEVWGAGRDEHEAARVGQAKAWEQRKDRLISIRTRPATEEAVASVQRGDVEAVVFEPRLDLFATSAEIDGAEAKIKHMENRWQSWFETKKKAWEQEFGAFRSKLLGEMASAFALDTDDGTVVIVDQVPKWRTLRASTKERNALMAEIAINSDNLDYLQKYRSTLAQISKEVEGRWPEQRFYVNLSEDSHRAAEELAICLGNRAHLEALNPPPRHKLRKIGEAIWGGEWISPMARALNISVRTIHRYAAGDSTVPDGIFERLAPCISQAKAELQARLEMLNRL